MCTVYCATSFVFIGAHTGSVHLHMHVVVLAMRFIIAHMKPKVILEKVFQFATSHVFESQAWENCVQRYGAV